MEILDPENLADVLAKLRSEASREEIRVTQHAQQEMVEEEIYLDDVLEAIQDGEIIENYPQHRRGACCLLSSYTRKRRPLHVVCTTSREVLILITVYEPKPPKWITPTERGRRP